MRPFIGWSATVVITLGQSRMGVAALCCHRPPGTTRLSRSWRFSLTPTREVMAHPSVWLSQRACCLKKLFTCQGTPCRRGQTVTSSGAGRTFRFGSPSIYNGHFFSKTWYCRRKNSENLSTLLSESAPDFVPMFFFFTLQRTKICRLLSMAVKKVFCAGCGRWFQLRRFSKPCTAIELAKLCRWARLPQSSGCV